MPGQPGSLSTSFRYCTSTLPCCICALMTAYVVIKHTIKIAKTPDKKHSNKYKTPFKTAVEHINS